ncbi:MAG: polysaccharide biosynthesis/export family protein [Gammaproteobacteria bacterium]|jgi:polysaccharide biosynthesis/export protein
MRKPVFESPLVAVFMLVAVLMLAACAGGSNVRNAQASLPAPDTTTSSGAYEGGTDYRIGASDLIEISVFGVDDLRHTARVNSNGQISMPLIGAVMAGGRTIPELEAEIAAKLRDGYLQNPHVSVFVKEFTSQRVTMEGAVKKPGIYPLTGKTTLLQAIAMAEGVDPLADLSGVVLFRQVDGRRAAAVYDLRKVRSGELEDPQIYGDDVIVVEQSGSKTAWRRLIESIPVLGIFSWL